MKKHNTLLLLLLALLLPVLAFAQTQPRKPPVRSTGNISRTTPETAAPLAAPIYIDDTYTAQQLVQNVLINGTCAGTSNFSISGFDSYAYFSNSEAVFPFSEGILLSTSAAAYAPGPIDNSDPVDNSLWLGDNDLEQALGISNTYNATVLEFDFTPTNDHFRFEYIFASKEYAGSYQCEFSDGFAFLLKPAGSTDEYQNLAVLPVTGTPVSVTAIHPNVPGSCGPMNEEYFNGYNPGNYPINFSGQTIVMTAEADVVPGTVYHIKLVIADQTDTRYQSAIFINAKSFNIGLDLGPDRASDNALCQGETLLLETQISGTNTYQWYKNDFPIPLATAAQYLVNSPGTYSVIVTPVGSACTLTDKIKIEYSGPVLLNNPVSLTQCDSNNDGIAIFNLSKADQLLVANGTVTYFESMTDAHAGTDPIMYPLAFENSSVSQLVAKVVNNSGCTDFATVNLQISNNRIATPPPIVVCDMNAQDGITPIRLSQKVTPSVLNGLPAGVSAEYYASEALANTESTPLPNDFVNTIPYQQSIYARIVNGPDCYGITEVRIVIDSFNPNDFKDETTFICDGTATMLTAPSGFASYLWSTGETSGSISVTAANSYVVTVTNANGCIITKNFQVLASGIGTVVSVEVDDFAQEQNSALIHYSGSGLYEFSIDGVRYQDSPLFTGLAPGEYPVYLKDLNGCGISPPYFIYIMDYPRFFTPNGDGINDFWKIKFSEREPGMTISIFDRYGKFLGNYDGNSRGWNGIFEGKTLPATDYWFIIRKPDGKEYRGHFSLKR